MMVGIQKINVLGIRVWMVYYIYTHSYVKFKAMVRGEKYKYQSVLLLFSLYSLSYGLFGMKGKRGGATINFTLLFLIQLKWAISVLCEC